MKKLLSTAKAVPVSAFSTKQNPFTFTTLRDIYSENLTDIVTDDPEIFQQITSYLKETSPEEESKARFYRDKLLPLYKLSHMENALDEVQKEKIWLNSGGFIVIQRDRSLCLHRRKQREIYRKEKSRRNLSQNQSGSS